MKRGGSPGRRGALVLDGLFRNLFLIGSCSTLPSISGHKPLQTYLPAPLLLLIAKLLTWVTPAREWRGGAREKHGISPVTVLSSNSCNSYISHNSTSYQAGWPWSSFYLPSDSTHELILVLSFPYLPVDYSSIWNCQLFHQLYSITNPLD